jgi:hypothetical protein
MLLSIVLHNRDRNRGRDRQPVSFGGKGRGPLPPKRRKVQQGGGGNPRPPLAKEEAEPVAASEADGKPASAR